jgi:hypothetical protein
MYVADQIAVAVLLILWFGLDVAVVLVDKSDVHAAEYLTNQIWMVTTVAKLALVVDVVRVRDMHDQDTVSLCGWATSLLFIVAGTAQAGVLGGFFLLTWLDCTLLTTMMKDNVHTLSEVMVWNHARHVTVCFLHLSITWSLRWYLSSNAHAIHDIRILCSSIQTSYTLFCAFALLIPVSIGLVHSYFFDDKLLYMFVDEAINYKCQFAFGTAAMAATIYYVFVPLRLEQVADDTPQLKKEVLRFFVAL